MRSLAVEMRKPSLTFGNLRKRWFQNRETTNPKRVQSLNTHLKKPAGSQAKQEDEIVSKTVGVEAKLKPRLQFFTHHAQHSLS
jgi:hypothetical protein